MVSYKEVKKEIMSKNPKFWEGYEKRYQEFERNELGHLLKEKRKEAGMSQMALGTILHVSKQNISKIERNASESKLSTIENLADKLGYKLKLQLVPK